MKRWISALCILACACLLAVFVNGGRVAAASADKGTPLAVLMYHQLSANDNQYSEHVIPRSAFEKDIQLLLELGYTPISAEHLVRFCNGDGYLPDKPILITFDDGNICFYRYAYPILLEYGIPAVLSPVAGWVEKESENERPSQYIIAVQAKEMMESGLVEIGNHSYNMHNASTPRRGVLKKKGESLEQYTGALTSDLQRAQDYWRESIGFEPQVFAYPYGFCNSTSEEIIQGMGFTITLGCWERINYVSDPTNLVQLGRFNRAGGISSAKFIGKIDKLYE